MTYQEGDRVLVNVAPFIGSLRRNKDSVPCRILSVEDGAVEVVTEEPYRPVRIWISASWIESRTEADLLRGHEPDPEPLCV
jgi:hypothetical protein